MTAPNPLIFGKRMRRSGVGYLLHDAKSEIKVSMLPTTTTGLDSAWRFTVSVIAGSYYSQSYYASPHDAAAAVETLINDISKRLERFRGKAVPCPRQKSSSTKPTRSQRSGSRKAARKNS